MGGTKGSHIVLDHPELLAATGGRELFFENSDGRIVLIYPLKGRVLVGTTDLEHDMADPIVCTEAEVDYFIELIGQVLPDIDGDRDQIVYRFVGRASAARPRRHRPRVRLARLPHRRRRRSSAAMPTVLSLVGGKWTTFRASAEHLADEALELLARPRAPLHEAAWRSAAGADSRPPSARGASGSIAHGGGLAAGSGRDRCSTATARSPPT